MKLRQMEIVTDLDKLEVDLQATFMKYKTIKQWAYIVHDKDDTRPHYHIYLHFDSSVDTALVAKWFKVPENFISKVKGRQADILKYLTHSNDTQKYKHQYDTSEVFANFNFEKIIEESEIIGNFEEYSYAQQLEYVNSLPIGEKIKSFNQLQKLWQIQCQHDCLSSSRDMQVIFITGKAGVGKTYYAKKLLDRMGYDYCISSSSNDPFQDYLGQKAIILDDLRDSAFELEDLLKILDNDTKSSVRSRFTNKVFNGKVLIVTSSVPVNYWYSWLKSGLQKDDLNQLYRRIGTFVRVKENTVEVYDSGLDGNGYPIGEPVIIENELRLLAKADKEKVSISKFFKDMDIPF